MVCYYLIDGLTLHYGLLSVHHSFQLDSSFLNYECIIVELVTESEDESNGSQFHNFEIGLQSEVVEFLEPQNTHSGSAFCWWILTTDLRLLCNSIVMWKYVLSGKWPFTWTVNYLCSINCLVHIFKWHFILLVMVLESS